MKLGPSSQPLPFHPQFLSFGSGVFNLDQTSKLILFKLLLNKHKVRGGLETGTLSCLVDKGHILPWDRSLCC